jgi:carbon monoxide dehydrogenase subunit G
MMNDTQMIRIEVEPKEVVNFLSDPANLPRWAIGFAASVEQTADGWVVTTASGDRLQIELVSNESAGTVDFVMSPAPGVTVTAWSRVVPVDSASLV